MLGAGAALAWEPEVVLRLSGRPSESYACTLRGLFKGTLHVGSALPIARSAELTVSFGKTTVAGTVLYCRRKDGGYLICITVTSPGEGTRRQDPRLPVNRPCIMTALGKGDPTRLHAVIVDVSASGMGVRVPEALFPGTMVCVQADELVAAGQVLHCRLNDEGQFVAGVEITDLLWGEKAADSSWSKRGMDWLKRVR